jgi:hypothetical protein
MTSIRRLLTVMVSATLGLVVAGQAAFAEISVLPSTGSGPTDAPATSVSSGSGLSTWKIAVITVGVAVATALVTLAAGRFVSSRRLQHRPA